MKFATLPACDHPQVALRPIVEADLQAWFDYLMLPMVHDRTSWNLASVDDLRPHAFDADADAPDAMLRVAIADRTTDRLVGTIGFHSVSARDRRAEIAYDLAPAMWGRGIATTVVALVVRWAHEHVGLVRVQGTTLRGNTASEAVLQRTGFAYEGLLRGYRMVRGVPGDFRMYAHVVDATDVA